MEAAHESFEEFKAKVREILLIQGEPRVLPLSAVTLSGGGFKRFACVSPCGLAIESDSRDGPWTEIREASTLRANDDGTVTLLFRAAKHFWEDES